MAGKIRSITLQYIGNKEPRFNCNKWFQYELAEKSWIRQKIQIHTLHLLTTSTRDQGGQER